MYCALIGWSWSCSVCLYTHSWNRAALIECVWAWACVCVCVCVWYRCHHGWRPALWSGLLLWQDSGCWEIKRLGGILVSPTHTYTSYLKWSGLLFDVKCPEMLSNLFHCSSQPNKSKLVASTNWALTAELSLGNMTWSTNLTQSASSCWSDN